MRSVDLLRDTVPVPSLQPPESRVDHSDPAAAAFVTNENADPVTVPATDSAPEQSNAPAATSEATKAPRKRSRPVPKVVTSPPAVTDRKTPATSQKKSRPVDTDTTPSGIKRSRVQKTTANKRQSAQDGPKASKSRTPAKEAVPAETAEPTVNRELDLSTDVVELRAALEHYERALAPPIVDDTISPEVPAPDDHMQPDNDMQPDNEADVMLCDIDDKGTRIIVSEETILEDTGLSIEFVLASYSRHCPSFLQPLGASFSDSDFRRSIVANHMSITAHLRASLGSVFDAAACATTGYGCPVPEDASDEQLDQIAALEKALDGIVFSHETPGQ